MTEFDQQLHDLAMEGGTFDRWEPYDHGFIAGVEKCCRISAERQAVDSTESTDSASLDVQSTPTPSDTELLVIYRNGTDKFYEDGGYQPADLLRDEPADAMRIAGIRAVREALGAWPQTPEGWTLISINLVEVESPMIAYTAHLITDLGDDTAGLGPTPQAALAAAIAQVQEA